jgi:hypothetical protein
MMNKIDIEEIDRIAMERGGKCISREITSNNLPILLECTKGHRWETIPFNVKKGTWCPVCAKNVKYTLQEMQEIAAIFGGKCISSEYTNMHTPMLWECKEGHRWETMANHIVNDKSWCPICNRPIPFNPISISEMQEIALSRGGRCLSEKIINSHTKALWECEKGHRWEAVPNSIKQGTWCPICSNRKKITIQDMVALAKSKRGTCLSTEYVDYRSKMRWKCKNNHIWESSLRTIKNGSWCPICFGNSALNIEVLRRIAESKKGKCLAEKIDNRFVKVLWECERGHRWWSTPVNIQAGTWCPQCVRDSQKLTIDIMREIAESKGGICLSENYINYHTKLMWKCERGHVWNSTPSIVLREHWCPVCANNNRRHKIKTNNGDQFGNTNQ